MLNSKLPLKEIIEGSFINTENSIASLRSETCNWESYSAKSTKETLETLISIFTNDVQFFAQLDPNNDVIARKLAFKGTESLLTSWKICLNKYDWYCSTIRTRLNEIQTSLTKEKSAFIKLSEQLATAT